MIFYYILFTFSVFLASIAQILLKISANKKYLSKKDEYIYHYVIFSFGIFLLTTFLTIFSFNGGVPLKYAPIIESSQFIFVLILGKIFLKEKLSKIKIFGTLLILIGILVFCLDF
nr:4-amino-4-deoxy-L-arabinose-phosphoundecaprenol flippase subunit ArnE [Candidatus Prometheoarchaeum syntrophicum]